MKREQVKMECKDNMRENIITGPYRATKLWNEVICAFRNNVPVSRHRRYMKTYENCFTASDAIDWLHCYLKSNNNFGCDVTRAQTIQLLQKLHRARVIEDVRGSKHNRADVCDNGRLLRCKFPSPAKIARSRTPLRCRTDIINSTSAPQNGPIKLDLDQTVEPMQALPECNVAAKQLSSTDNDNIWKNITLDRLQEVLQASDLTEVLDSSLVIGRNIMHNCVYINKSGIVTNIPQKDQLPHWALSAMKCLAHWPQKVDENLPSYPGFERDVFRVVKDYFCGLDEPLMTYEMYEVILNVFVIADGTIKYDYNKHQTQCAAMTSFESVENLLLDLTNTGSTGYVPSLCQTNTGSTRYVPPVSQKESVPTVSRHSSEYSPLCQRGSAPTIDLSPIHPIPGKSYSSSSFAKYETAFGPENKTVTRVYYRNGIATDYNHYDDQDVLSKTPVETHFESSDPFHVPILDECQNYEVNFARIKSVNQQRNETDKQVLYRRRSSGYPVPSACPECVSQYSSHSNCAECTVHQNSQSYNGYMSSKSSEHFSPPLHEEPETHKQVKRKLPRSKSSCSLHSTAVQSSLNSQSQFHSELKSTHTGKEQLYGSNESLPGRSLSLSDLMHAATAPKCKLKRSNTVTELSDHDREERTKDALQLVCLLLPPANRRKLHLLLKLMGRMSANPEIELDHLQTTRTILLETFSPCILSCQDETDREDLLIMRIVSFLTDHYHHVLSVPSDLTSAVQDKLSSQTQTTSSEDRTSVSYCQRVSQSEYETQRLSNSQRALRELLEEIINDKTMSYKDKKKRLKTFQKTYPDIYAQRFPSHETKSSAQVEKPKIKPPLLVKPLLKLKGLRI